MKAVIASAGKVASKVSIGKHELLFDQPATVPGGEDRGPSPLDVLAVSVAACAHYYAAAFLHARGLPIGRLRVEMESLKERTPAPRIGRLTLKVLVPPGLTTQQRDGIERAIKACPAYGTLLHPPSVELVIEADEPEGAELRSA